MNPSNVSSHLGFLSAARSTDRRREAFFWLSLPWLMLVVYGSLAPLKFYPPSSLFSLASSFGSLAAWGSLDFWASVIDAGVGILTAPRWWDSATLDHYDYLKNSDTGSDLVLNLLLYFPLGFLWRLRWVERQGKSWVSVLGVTAVCLAICWTIECIQSLMEPIRTASLNDVWWNTLGGAIAAMVAPRCMDWMRRAAFWCYCRLTYPTHQVKQQLRPWRMALGIAVLLAGLGVIIAGYHLAVTHGQPAAGSRYLGVRWLPLMQAIDMPYGQGIESLLVPVGFYLLLGGWLWLLSRLWRWSLRLSSLLVILPALALTMEIARRLVAHQRADMTQPTLAFFVASLLVGLGWLWPWWLDHSCRRQKSQPVAFDRRRREHVYG